MEVSGTVTLVKMCDEGFTASFNRGVTKHQAFIVYRHLPTQLMHIHTDIEIPVGKICFVLYLLIQVRLTGRRLLMFHN